MKNPFFLILIFTITCALQAQNLKVISYNIRYNNPADNENSWDNRKDFLKNQLAFYEPDVFGLQEALPDQIDYLANHLTNYVPVGTSRDEGGKGEATPIFYNKERFRLEKKTPFGFQTLPKRYLKAGMRHSREFALTCCC